MQKTVDQIVLDILVNQMQIDKNRAWVRDQNFVTPDGDGLFVVAGMINVGQILNVINSLETRTLTKPGSTEDTIQTVEIMRTNMSENIQIDIFSRNNDALARRAEVPMSLGSIYSQQQQEKFDFKIFPRGISFVNTSETEGGSQLKKFSFVVPCFTWYKKERILLPIGGDYYDDFTTRVDDEKTIGTPEGIFEFEITPETPEP